MALLRLENGDFYTDHKVINEIIEPVEIGAFDLPRDVAERIADPAVKFDRAFADILFKKVYPDLKGMLDRAGFDVKERRAAVYIPPASASDPHQFITLLDGAGEVEPAPLRDEDFGAYLVPHKFPVNDWHFCFAGTMAKGLQLTDGSQAVLYIFAGEWMRLRPSVLNWPVFQSGSPIVGLSCFEEEANEHGAYTMELHPEFSPHETMKF